MQYFTDGLGRLVRVDTSAARDSREFFFAKAEKLDAEGTWFQKPKLMVELLNSGYYRPATAEEIGQIISAIIPTLDALRQGLHLSAHTFSSTEEIKHEDSLDSSATLISA